MASTLHLADRGERLVYRMAGLPVALAALWFASQGGIGGDPDKIDAVFAARYWRPGTVGECLELAAALVAWPVALLGGALWYTARNGSLIRRRTGKRALVQFAEQLRLYFSAGVLAPWYYILSLHDGGGAVRARTFFQRFETKPCVFPMLKRKKGSPLTDKARFADHCARHRVRCVETLLTFDGNEPARTLPDRDLFVKPCNGRGGRGAERWDRVASHRYEGPGGVRLDAPALAERFARMATRRSLIVQPRLRAHRALADITSGALPTVRLVTCLDEAGRPEVIGAVMRMSIGANRTVDNLHAGGIAAAIDLRSGKLSRATNLGSDAQLGWLANHPDTGAVIEGRCVPCWPEAKRLAVKAHRAFCDRVVIGWDIAILADGPILVEGNGNPDMDIIQRFMPVGLRAQRFGTLVAYHLGCRARAARQHLSPAATGPYISGR